jgi:dienelactone hydrolase
MKTISRITAGFFLCSVAALAQVELPKPTGEYPVGTTTFTWVDNDREDIVSDDPSDHREVIVQLWYPTQPAPGAAVAPYFPELGAVLEIMRTKFGPRGDQMAKAFENLGSIRTHAFENAPVAAKRSAYPVLLFSPGGDMSRHFHTVQAEELASHGYVVAVMSHAHSTFDLFPGGRLSTSDPRWNPARGATDEERDRHFEELTNILAADARFTLSQLERLNKADADNRFTGKLDLSKVAILGHSRGGKTVSRVLVTDTRVRGGVIYDNLPPLGEQARGYDRPVLEIRAEGWEEKDGSALKALLQKNRAASYDIVIKGSGHRNFSDAHITTPERFKSEIDARRALVVSNACTMAFLDIVLNGKPSQLLQETAAAFPEALLTVYRGK